MSLKTVCRFLQPMVHMHRRNLPRPFSGAMPKQCGRVCTTAVGNDQGQRGGKRRDSLFDGTHLAYDEWAAGSNQGLRRAACNNYLLEPRGTTARRSTRLSLALAARRSARESVLESDLVSALMSV